MVCSSVKVGQNCLFMSKKGCGFNGGTCHIIVEACEGCQKAVQYPIGKYCISFPDPAAKWHTGNCSMATHLEATTKKETAKVNPLKASKRQGR
ncbi:MAG: PxxKW family cysteine-rich protein [Pseudomonadota bacterium]